MKKTLGFKEWLAQEADRERASAESAAIVDDWKDAAAELFAQVVQWLAEDDTQKLFRVQTGKLRKDEEGLGPYEIASLRISLSSRHVDLLPIGRNIVGAVGRDGDLGFRAEGGISMTNGVDKYVLYRVIAPDGKQWVIVDDVEFHVRPLTRATFEDALQDLLS